MPKLSTATLSGLQNADLGPGIVLKNVLDLSPAGIDKVLAGNKAFGQKIGAMTSAPSISISRNTIDITENIVGLNAALKGARQVQRVDASIEVEFAEVTHENYHILNPGQVETDWMSSANASLDVGTGDSQFSLAARNAGIGGNSITLTMTGAAGASAPTTVSVSENAITVTLGTGATAGVVNATAKEVVGKINADSAATLLVQAGLSGTSNGTGVVAAAASTPLAGGTAGSRIGSTFRDQATIKLTDYMKNMCFVMESTQSKINTIYTFFDVIATEDFEQGADDDANISGISQTYMAHASESSYDATSGVYLPAYERRALDPVMAVV